MKPTAWWLRRWRVSGAAIFTTAFLFSAAWATAAGTVQGSRKNNPAGKVYFADVNGEAQISTSGRVEDVAKRSVYETQDVVIETKKTDAKDEAAKTSSTMVYSNGTSAFLGADTRLEIKKFVQDPFKADRSDMSIEPSISQTQVFVERGTVALSTSQLVPGSSMVYETPFGTVNIRGRKIVIETDDEGTTFSMLEGDSTVQFGDPDGGICILRTGEQAVIRSGGPGQPNIIEVRKIPAPKLTSLDDMLAIATMAQKTVYFEMKDRAGNSGTAPQSLASGANKAVSSTADDTPVTVFDGAAANTKFTSSDSVLQQIVAIEVVQVNLPVQFTVSPARLITPGK